MASEFGHRLGLPGALSGVPLSPLVRRYRDLVAEQHVLGLRHVGEALVAPGERLRVLDGVYVSRAPRGWRRVDAAGLRQAAGTHAALGALLHRLADLYDHDPSGLRRVLLYQLIELLQSHPQGDSPATAVSLGVDASEAAALVHAAGARRRLGAAERAAAEELQDVLERRRLRHAARLASTLPPDGGQDPLLARRLHQIAGLVRRTDDLLTVARRQEKHGDVARAADGYLQAARLATDSSQALRGLVRTHLPAAGTAAPLTVTLGPDTAHLAWADDGRTTAWRVARLQRAVGGGQPTVADIRSHAKDTTAEDTRLPLGSEVRYAAFPLRAGVVAGPPLVSAALLATPEVTGLGVADGRERLTATWTPPPHAAGVEAVLTGPDGGERTFHSAEGGFTARGLAPGTYRVRVRCRYRTPDGREVPSPGAGTDATVHPWPAPVRDLTATAQDGGVLFDWTGAENAEVRLVIWPGDAPSPGTELAGAPAGLPPALVWPRIAPGVLAPPPGLFARVSAVAVLGARAVAGPGVWVEAPRPVTALVAERTDPGQARVTFDWPADVGQVTVVLEQDGRWAEHRVARSAFLRTGLSVPLGPSPARLTVTPLPRAPHVTVVPAADAVAVLPADVTIAYRLVTAPRVPLRRRPPKVQITLSSPAGQPAEDLPEFVLVARPGDGPAPIRPRDPADGVTLLRLSGGELRRAGHVEREIDTGACRPPYVLRGFLLGGRAASVRLDEPSPSTLVVR